MWYISFFFSISLCRLSSFFPSHLPQPYFHFFPFPLQSTTHLFALSLPLLLSLRLCSLVPSGYEEITGVVIRVQMSLSSFHTSYFLSPCLSVCFSNSLSFCSCFIITHYPQAKPYTTHAHEKNINRPYTRSPTVY